MAGIMSYDSNSISTLFSSLGSRSNKNTTTDMLGISYTDYATIRSGSYFKLLRSYYSEGSNKTDSTSSNKTSTSTAKDTTAKLAATRQSAEDLKSSADKLLEKGSKSLFHQTTSTDADGKTTTKYDTDKIYSAVKEVVSNYNSLIDKAGDSNVTGILSAAASMTNMSKANAGLLSSIGITRAEKNKLVLDEETFKKADMSTVKSLFHTTGSYGYQISAQASMIDYYASNEAGKSNTYSKNGMYTYNYNTGEIYNSGF